MTTKPFLMGAEVEFSMSGHESQVPHQRARFHRYLLDVLRAEHRWLPDVRTPTGIYIDNGSRYYLDSGCHNEFSSPELFTPRQIAVYDRAAEQILLRAKSALKGRSNGLDICLTKNNVNFGLPDRAAWGQHEAYTCWIPLEKAATQLIPHLVSRIPYAGAGYLSAHPSGMGFELSQRARHMTRLTGQETMHDRAIFCTRAWKPSDVSKDGWTRTNLISKDSQRCSFGMYLSYGVTGALFMIMNEHHTIGRRVQLKDPVAAMRTFSLDPSLKVHVPLANGRQATAIDIQRVYLREAKPFIESGDYPDWTCEVLDYWSTTLDQLENQPLHLANRLDTYLKLAIFHYQLERAGLTWESLQRALQALEHMRSVAPEIVVQAVVNGSSSGLDRKQKSLFTQLAKQFAGAKLSDLQFAVRLQALELNYHELGGLFDALAAAGRVDAVVVTLEAVHHAMHNPPTGGRAEARSKCISELCGQDWLCDWQYVLNHEEGKWVDLRDPFGNARSVAPLPAGFKQPRRLHGGVAELLMGMRE